MENKDLTHRIIGACMEVHGFLGNGFQEKIYQRALCIEFDQMGIDNRREHTINI